MKMTGRQARALRVLLGCSTLAVFRARWASFTDAQQQHYFSMIASV